MCDNKKLKFRKEQEANGLLGIKPPLSQISLLGTLLF